MEDNKQEKNKIKIKTKSNKIYFIILILVLIVLIATLSMKGYAKFVQKREGTISARIAKEICNMNVKHFTELSSEEVIPGGEINPYCIVKINNYNNIENSEQKEITQVAVDYTIEVKPKGEYTLPEYYWQDSEGVIVARSVALRGKLGCIAAEEKEYKIVFINPGTEETDKIVEFNLIAVGDE